MSTRDGGDKRRVLMKHTRSRVDTGARYQPERTDCAFADLVDVDAMSAIQPNNARRCPVAYPSMRDSLTETPLEAAPVRGALFAPRRRRGSDSVVAPPGHASRHDLWSVVLCRHAA